MLSAPSISFLWLLNYSRFSEVWILVLPYVIEYYVIYLIGKPIWSVEHAAAKSFFWIKLLQRDKVFNIQSQSPLFFFLPTKKGVLKSFVNQSLQFAEV